MGLPAACRGATNHRAPPVLAWLTCSALVRACLAGWLQVRDQFNPITENQKIGADREADEDPSVDGSGQGGRGLSSSTSFQVRARGGGGLQGGGAMRAGLLTLKRV